MIMHPREQKVLDAIGTELSAGDPRLAAMLTIFTRLTALDGNPPDEDLITLQLELEPEPEVQAEADWPQRRLWPMPPSPLHPSLPLDGPLYRAPRRAPRPAAPRQDPRRGRPLWAAILPLALLVLLAVTIAVGLATTLRCEPGTGRAVCQPAGTTRTPGQSPGAPAGGPAHGR
jgi:hypothetical protein